MLRMLGKEGLDIIPSCCAIMNAQQTAETVLEKFTSIARDCIANAITNTLITNIVHGLT